MTPGRRKRGPDAGGVNAAPTLAASNEDGQIQIVFSPTLVIVLIALIVACVLVIGMTVRLNED